jgi:peptidyl-prolyl cis-trans isomerase SurA
MIDRLTAQKGTDEYHVYEIYKNATPDRAQEVSGVMQKLIEQMRQGTPFDYLARTYSESSTRARGGDLGWVQPAMLPDALAQAVQEMQPGQVAGPIPLSAGLSIVYLAEKHKVGMSDPRDARLSIRQLSISFPKDMKEPQRNARADQFAKATQAIRGCGDVSKAAAAINAEVVDRDGIAIRDLPPALQNLVLPMQVGQTTQPFGSLEDGVRAFVICGRDDPPAANTPSMEQVQEQLEDQRVNLRAERMLRDLRRDALIEYR